MILGVILSSQLSTLVGDPQAPALSCTGQAQPGWTFTTPVEIEINSEQSLDSHFQVVEWGNHRTENRSFQIAVNDVQRFGQGFQATLQIAGETVDLQGRKWDISLLAFPARFGKPSIFTATHESDVFTFRPYCDFK